MSLRWTWTSIRPGRARRPLPFTMFDPEVGTITPILCIFPFSIRIDPSRNSCPVQTLQSFTTVTRWPEPVIGSAFFLGTNVSCAFLTKEDALLLRQVFGPCFTLVTVACEA